MIALRTDELRARRGPSVKDSGMTSVRGLLGSGDCCETAPEQTDSLRTSLILERKKGAASRGWNMKKNRCHIYRFLFALLLFPLVAHGEQTQEDLWKFIEESLYGDLRKIESFGFIHVHVKNSKEKGLRPDEKELTDYLKLRFKNNFANVPFKDQSANLSNILESEKIGRLWCGVWTVGSDYPVAYHVECKAGPFSKPEMLSDEHLGYGNSRNVPDQLRKSIDEMVSEFAVRFFKTRKEI